MKRVKKEKKKTKKKKEKKNREEEEERGEGREEVEEEEEIPSVFYRKGGVLRGPLEITWRCGSQYHCIFFDQCTTLRRCSCKDFRQHFDDRNQRLVFLV